MDSAPSGRCHAHSRAQRGRGLAQAAQLPGAGQGLGTWGCAAQDLLLYTALRPGGQAEPRAPPPCPGLEGLGFRQGHSHPFSGSEGRRPAGSRGPVTPGLAQSAGVAASCRAGSASLRPRLLWQWVPPRGAGGRPGREGLEPGRPPQPRRLPAACRPACARQAAPARCRCPEEPDLRARAPGPPSPAGEPQRCRPAWSLATWTESPWLVSVLRVSESTAHGLGRL